MSDLEQKYDEFLCLYEELKQEVRKKDQHLYEKWKAGGFLVDDDIISMYPTLGRVVEDLTSEEEPEDEE